MIDHRLAVLRLLAHHGTVTATAEALHYTPSAVSQQLRSLADDLGIALLERQGRGVRLTPAARILLARADDLTAQWEAVRAEMLVTAPQEERRLTLCGFSTAAAALLPPVAARLRADRPELDVRIVEAEPVECFDLLLAGAADIAVVVATASIPSRADRRFDQWSLLDDPLDLLVPLDHRLAGQPAASFHDTMDAAWIVDRPGSPYHQLFQAACAAAGFVPEVAHQVAEWDTAAALVSAGLGIALVPRLARLPEGYGVRRVQLRGDPRPSRRIVTGVRRGSGAGPLIAEALGLLRQTAADVLEQRTYESGLDTSPARKRRTAAR